MADGSMASPPVDLTYLLGSVRHMTIALYGRRCRAEGVDVEDLIQDVYLRVLENQRRAASRYDATRGQRPSSYQYTVARSAGANALRLYRRWRRDVLTETGCAEEVEDRMPDAAARVDETLRGKRDTGDTLASAVERLMEPLDTDEERAMALYLAAGCTLTETRRAMGLTEEQGTELRTRVRALLMGLREEG